jgi:hypothetical protein
MTGSDREERARARRATWSGGVVRLGEAKTGLYADLSHAERLAALIELSERAWLAAGRQLPSSAPRGEWPGEVFECGQDA